MNTAVIEANHLTRTFRGGVVAVNDLDLQVQRGAVYGLLGRNGSGKTTTLRLLLGLLRPDRGTARMLGWDFWRASRATRSRVGYVAQSQQLPGWMTLEELCRCLSRLNERWDAHLARELADDWGLPWKQPMGSLSVGTQRKASILLAFAGRPEVLVLDEPAAGFDLVARRELLEQIIHAISESDGCTVLLSTHMVADLERVADYVGVMKAGGLALSTRLDDLLQCTKRVQVIFEDDEPPPDFAIPGALRSRRSGAVVSAVARLSDSCDLEALRNTMNVRVQVFPIGLEELFIELFGDDARNGNGSMIDVEAKDKP